MIIVNVLNSSSIQTAGAGQRLCRAPRNGETTRQRLNAAGAGAGFSTAPRHGRTKRSGIEAAGAAPSAQAASTAVLVTLPATCRETM